MLKVLITGMDSFTGRFLSAFLRRRGFDVFGTSLSRQSDKLFLCDICNRGDIEAVLGVVRPDFVVHLAGISFAAHGTAEDFYRVNTIGTMLLLEALLALDIRPRKVVLASSASVYGNQEALVLDESLCPMPANHYGASKYAMECLARGFFEKLNILIARPFNYTGVGQAGHFLIPKIVAHFSADKKVIALGNLDVVREFNDVDFVCEVYCRLLACEAKSEVVNIASNRGVRLLDVIELMNEMAGYDIEVVVNPDFVRKDEIKFLTGSSDKLFGLVGEVEQRSFRETLGGMYEV